MVPSRISKNNRRLNRTVIRGRAEEDREIDEARSSRDESGTNGSKRGRCRKNGGDPTGHGREG